MAILNFPSNPSTGDQYTENGVVYTWSGEAWTANGAENTDARYVQVTGDTMTGNLNVACPTVVCFTFYASCP